MTNLLPPWLGIGALTYIEGKFVPACAPGPNSLPTNNLQSHTMAANTFLNQLDSFCPSFYMTGYDSSVHAAFEQ